MNKGINISVTFHEQSKQYRKQIGSQIGRNGEPKGKVWLLGPDEVAAKRKALALQAEWEALREQGHVVWPNVEATGRSNGSTSDSVEVNASQMTVGDAIEMYREEICRRCDLGIVSTSYRNTTNFRLDWLYRAISGRMLLSDVGPQEIKKAVQFFVSRPRRSPQRLRSVETRKMSIRVAKDLVSQLKAVFRFVQDQLPGTGFSRPPGFDRLFQIPWDKVRTSEERELCARRAVEGEVTTYSIDELAAIWAESPERVRLYMLLALNFGWTSKEIADARTFNFYLDRDPPLAVKERSKTSVMASWEIWPETANALRANQAPANPEKRWLLSQTGLPLVRVEEFRRDAIYEAWKRTLAKTEESKVQRLGFRFLRKTAANWLKQHGGLEVSDMFLSHGEPGGEINRFYANRRWELMWESLGAFREALYFLDD